MVLVKLIIKLVNWNNAEPTSSVFSREFWCGLIHVNGTGVEYILFRRVKGYSKFGTTQVMEMLMEHLSIQDLNLHF